MVDPTLPTDRSADSVCPWCSTSVTPETAICPSCGAILIAEEERDLPGVTAVDLAVLRGEKKPPGRSRLLSWISGEYPDEDAPATVTDSQALAPPDPAVQREILRLEIEAELANLQAEADALRSEAAAEGRELPADEPLDTEAATDTEGTGDAIPPPPDEPQPPEATTPA
jgi:hypothetical protein